MPVSTVNGWTGGGLVPSYTAVAHALAGGSHFNPAAQPTPPTPTATTPGTPTTTQTGTPTPGYQQGGTPQTAGFSPDVWAKLGSTVQRRILQSFNKGIPIDTGTALNTRGGVANALGPGPVSSLINPTAGTDKTGGLNSDVWGRLGNTVRQRLLNAIKTTPTTKPVNPTDLSTNPFVAPGTTGTDLGWAGGPNFG